MIEFLTNVVKEAYLQIKDTNTEISLKGEKDYVTNCDLIIEKYIIDEIRKNYSEVEIISEEFNHRKTTCEKYFTIDPIDGTINFANGLDIWGIQIAYIEKGETLASVLYFPKLEILIKSEKGKGTFINNVECKVKKYIDLKNSLVAFDFSKINKNNYILEKEVSEKIMRIREFGAACFGFGMVASGKMDGYYIMQNTPWDIEPGLLACVEAGAKFYRDSNCTIVANSNEIIQEILLALKK